MTNGERKITVITLVVLLTVSMIPFWWRMESRRLKNFANAAGDTLFTSLWKERKQEIQTSITGIKEAVQRTLRSGRTKLLESEPATSTEPNPASPTTVKDIATTTAP